MSGIFQLISKYQNKTKRITSGKKRGKGSEEPSPAAAAASPVRVMTRDGQREVRIERSPALPPEIRRENVKVRPALVERLMGLEEKPAAAEGEWLVTTEEKRKMLLQAIEKCNQDLEALKNIIKSVQSSPAKPPSGAVLDDRAMITRSPTLGRIHSSNGYIVQQSRNKVAMDESMNSVIKKFKTCSFQTNREGGFVSSSSPVMQRSREMAESVEEACSDIACGEHGEARKIGAALQEGICTDLIHEVVKDLGHSPCKLSLPFDGCRRRLCL
ncbi:unnamed protein product [Cuscuta campestris]|uniref:DUF3741 domain-containing protein n=1 Tax=Cuscuta campestris TaxID=132261 RepID=A0A484L7F1_9ASTE|nr:unnamed protein product [Cuscuta campestris]